MKIEVPIEFFERDKDCSVVVDGRKCLFNDGASIVFSAQFRYLSPFAKRGNSSFLSKSKICICFSANRVKNWQNGVKVVGKFAGFTLVVIFLDMVLPPL